MKVKNLETSLKYFLPIVKESDSPLTEFDWENSTNEEVQVILEKDKEYYKSNYILYNSDDPLYYYSNYLVLSISSVWVKFKKI